MARSLNFQDVSWFLDLYEKGQLDLNPPYQRRSVWSPRDRRYFVDTILNDYPAPPVFLHKTLDDNGKSTYHVVDGKQRLSTVIDFSKGKIKIPADFAVTSLQNKKWKDVPKETRDIFWNYTIIVENLNDASDATLRSTFERINRNSRKLLPQEMRHAKFEGWFMQTAQTESEREEWKLFGLVTSGRIKRMQDVQFISELMKIVIDKDNAGFDQNALDDVYALYDDLSEVEDFSEDDFTDTFTRARSFVLSIIERKPEIKEFTKTAYNLYTLWAYIVIGADDARIADAATFADNYLKFLIDAAAYAAAGSPLHNEYRSSYEEAVAVYGTNSRGATTELPQRTNRYRALVQAMTGVRTIIDENI